MHSTPTPVTRQTCAALNAAGEPCKAGVKNGALYCFQHDPDRALDVAAARAKGGKNHSKPKPAPPIDLSTPELQRLAIQETINRVRRGDESLNIGRFVVYAVSLARPILELEGITERIAALEARMGEKA
jgi:hypothetical protein